MQISGALIILLVCVVLGNGKTVSFLEPNCGVPRSKSLRIIGGENPDMYENPWMVYIRNKKFCGGSLITARFVLSAAHCMTGNPSTVHLGEFDRSHRTIHAIQVRVDEEIPHPFYLKDTDMKYDIGLFRLAHSVRYSDYIKPICLPTNYKPLVQTSNLFATGWGYTEHGVLSNVLKKTALRQHSRGTCARIFRTHVDTSQICAGLLNSNVCQGDSGSPITAKYSVDGTIRILQLGLVSYGSKLCRTASVYTNVRHYMGWITNVVRGGGPQGISSPTRRPNNNNYGYIYNYPPYHYY